MMPMLNRIGLCSLTLAAHLLAGCSGQSDSDPTGSGAMPQGASGSDIAPESASSQMPIVLDGVFDDWNAIEPAVDEPAGDTTGGSPIDLGPVRVTHDEQFLFLNLDLGSAANLQVLPDGASIELWLDVDGLDATGVDEPHAITGADAIITFSAKQGNRPRMGIGLQSTTYTPDPDDPDPIRLSPYDVGLAFAPTYASKFAEIRIERGAQAATTPVWFTGESFSAYLRLIDSEGRVLDETTLFTHDLTRQDSFAETARTIPASAADSVRVMNWNVERGAMLANPLPFAATFAAIEPDVVLIQELRDSQSASMVDAWLEQHMSDDAANNNEWSVIVGEGGGNLRCAIASRVPITQYEALRIVPFPDRPDRQLRVAGAVAEFDGRGILFVASHLKCCGSAGSREDETRLMEVALLRDTLARALADDPVDGMVIAGDLNLVGSRDPLDELAASADINGRDLIIADLLQLDGRTNATWHDSDQPFVPGRLDWLLFSGSSLGMVEGFVFDSRDLSPEILARHQMSADATMASSDHFPLVADLQWHDGSSPGGGGNQSETEAMP